MRVLINNQTNYWDLAYALVQMAWCRATHWLKINKALLADLLIVTAVLVYFPLVWGGPTVCAALVMADLYCQWSHCSSLYQWTRCCLQDTYDYCLARDLYCEKITDKPLSHRFWQDCQALSAEGLSHCGQIGRRCGQWLGPMFTSHLSAAAPEVDKRS